jgi:catechol 2,3-dioxygenase-like lactoylglutathione lyase family enzyme
VPLHQIEHFLVLSDDMDGTRDWYERGLGLAAGERPPLPFSGHWLYADGVPVVHVADRDEYVAHASRLGLEISDGTGVVDHIAFGGSDYEAIKSGLEGGGVPFVENEIPGVMRQLFVLDPNGVRIEINVRVDG